MPKPAAAEMWQAKLSHHHLRLLLAMSLCVAALSPRTAAAGDAGGKPLITAVTKDAATSLYTAPLKDGHPLVLDLSGPIIWSTCDASHQTLESNSFACMRAHRYHPPGCPRTGHGRADAGDPYRCKCTAHPQNPLTKETASGDLTRVTLSANATDGKNPLRAVSFTAVASCAPDSLLAKLPTGAAGVAGLARSSLAFPAQVAATQNVANKFALCLPGGGRGVGVAIFGGGPFFLLPAERPDITTMLAGATPLHKYRDSPGYYISAKNGIAVNQGQVPLDGYVSALTIGLSTTIPYTELRADVYRPFVTAFDKAMGQSARITPPVAPFELCYNSTKLSPTRLGYFVPQIDLMLDGGKNWTVFGENSMVQVNGRTACFAFVEMKKADQAGYDGGAPPAAVIGGFQIGNNLLVFDGKNQRLSFSGLLSGRGYSCSKTSISPWLPSGLHA